MRPPAPVSLPGVVPVSRPFAAQGWRKSAETEQGFGGANRRASSAQTGRARRVSGVAPQRVDQLEAEREARSALD